MKILIMFFTLILTFLNMAFAISVDTQGLVDKTEARSEGAATASGDATCRSRNKK